MIIFNEDDFQYRPFSNRLKAFKRIMDLFNLIGKDRVTVALKNPSRLYKIYQQKFCTVTIYRDKNDILKVYWDGEEDNNERLDDFSDAALESVRVALE